MAPHVHVLGYGLACPVGLTADTALSAMYAGIRQIVECERVRDRLGEFVQGSMLRQVHQDASRTERTLFLARRAVAQACVTLGTTDISTVPCFLALPSPESSPPLNLPEIFDQLADVVRERTARRIEIRQDRLFARGRAATFLALHAAVAALGSGECAVALVGGLDSQVDPGTLSALAKDNRILSSGNPDGLIPGEGAAFVLLASQHAASVNQAACITSSAIGSEPHPLGREAPNIGVGATALFRELRERRATGRVDAVISAQTGETLFERAFAYAYLRNTGLMPEPLRLTCIGALIGDAGAAAGAIALVAGVAGLKGLRAVTPRHKSALIYGESDYGTVGGCIIEAVRRRG